MNDRAQSETIGVVLLVGVVVIGVATVGAFGLSNVGSDQRNFDATVQVTTDSISVIHGGGDPVPFSELLIVVRANGTTTRIKPDAGELASGDSDEVFEPGERWAEHNVSYSRDEVVTVRLFDSTSQLSEDSLYPNSPQSTGTGGPIATDTATPTVVDTPTPTDSTAPSVRVNTPDGGEVLAGGNTTTIEWTATDSGSGVSSVGIAYSTNNGRNWTTTASDIGNDGSYDWTIPEVNTTEALVRVTATDNAGNSANDTSNATFTIDSTAPEVTLESAGTEGNKIKVEWSASDNYVSQSATVVIELRKLSEGTTYTRTITISENKTSVKDTFSTEEGTYEVVVTVTDATGQSDRETGTATYSGPGRGN